MKVALIVPAAGASRRYTQAGAVRSKLDEDLGGRPVIQRTIEAFVKHEFVGPLIACVVVAGPNDEDDFSEFKLRHSDRIGMMGGVLCRGGVTHRYETVGAALKHAATLPVWEDCTHVAIHDAARPCASVELIERVFAAAEKHAAVIPAIDVSDTIKRTAIDENFEEERDPLAAILGPDPDEAPAGAFGGGSSAKKKGLKYTTETLDRAGLVQVQTPQVFEKDVITRAYAQKDLTSTDDAQLVERMFKSEGKGRVVVIDGESTNIKITRPGDLRLARAILGVKPPEERATHKRF